MKGKRPLLIQRTVAILFILALPARAKATILFSGFSLPLEVYIQFANEHNKNIREWCYFLYDAEIKNNV